MRCHPKNYGIRNSLAARMLIFLSRHRVPVLSRLFMYFLGCEIGLALPKSVFLPHPQGIVLHGGARIGEDVVIGHQVTIGARDLTAAAPVVEDGVYLGAGAKVLGGVPDWPGSYGGGQCRGHERCPGCRCRGRRQSPFAQAQRLRAGLKPAAARRAAREPDSASQWLGVRFKLRVLGWLLRRSGIGQLHQQPSSA